ncbi:uncharacterized protein LOC111016530 [Momordica charantia]|uniref:Uncharacterized protein LOC111016530 n=1 Tax=Momordica charantia TaxID=3673 RepID=A0A6J1D316_MOMCH|nr:uncharacterized protein LOC111016530 [Momordica charantia]
MLRFYETLKERYTLQDQLDPITLDHIDESNEWLIGTLEEEDGQEENELVFDDDDLTWGDVAEASGVREPIRQTRTYTRSKGKSPATPAPTTSRVRKSVQVVVSDDDDDTEEEEEELLEKGDCEDVQDEENLDLDEDDEL